MIYESWSEKQTRKIAAALADEAKPGTIICLKGQLGAGKTQFVKGFAEGLGITELVSSPTFTIVNEYQGGRLPLYHFDLYRIISPEQMQDTGYDEYFYDNGVCLVEWADIISELIPKQAIWIEIEHELSHSESFRRIRVGF